jgi:hypothetical protein
LGTLTIVGLICIVTLEVWRRAVAKRTPRWVTRAVIASYFALVAGIVFAWSGVIHTFSAIADASPADKASQLAAGISRALNGAAVGIACALVAASLLAVVTLRRHREPPPPARIA